MFPYIHKHYINNLFIFLFYSKPTFSPARLKYYKEYYLKYYSVFYTTAYRDAIIRAVIFMPSCHQFQINALLNNIKCGWIVYTSLRRCEDQNILRDSAFISVSHAVRFC